MRRPIRLAILLGAALALVAAVWFWRWGTVPCRPLDRWLDRSPCVAELHVPHFVLNRAQWPSVAFTPDGRRLAVAGIELEPGVTGSPPPQRPGLVELDPASGAELRRMAAGDYVRGLVGKINVSPSGRYVVGVFRDARAAQELLGGAGAPAAERASGQMRMWRLEGEAGGWESSGLFSKQPRIEFSASEAVVLVDDLFWQVQSGAQQDRELALAETWPRSGQGEALAPNKQDKVEWNEAEAAVDAIDKGTKQRRRLLATRLDPAPKALHTSLTFSRKGDRLAVLVSNGDDSLLQVWQVATGEKLYELEGRPLEPPVVWYPDDLRLLVSSGVESPEEGVGFLVVRTP